MNRLKSLKTFTAEFHPDITKKDRDDLISRVRVLCNLEYDENSPDLVVSFGGDGTLMRAARKYAPKDALIAGVSLGKLCFLNGFGKDDWEAHLKTALTENGVISERRMIIGSMNDRKMPALNDIVVHRGELMMARLKLYVNNTLVWDIMGDGVIVSTPTGSTAYNFSAGGPLMAAESNSLVVTPVAPFANGVKPIILNEKDSIMITSSCEDTYVITHDSEMLKENLRQHALTIKSAPYQANLLYPEGYNHWFRVRETFGIK